ncbi:MAG: hypothetical protein H5T41_00220 [Methanomassiliicoccales archaeon]|nr:hypothetical protein [Methanomassiliicoccales archaeon]
MREDETWILKRHHNVSEKFVREFFRIDDNHPLFKEATKIRIPIVRQQRMKGNSVHVWLVISLQYKNWINGIMILASKSQISIAESEQKTLMILNKQPGYVI